MEGATQRERDEPPVEPELRWTTSFRRRLPSDDSGEAAPRRGSACAGRSRLEDAMALAFIAVMAKPSNGRLEAR